MDSYEVMGAIISLAAGLGYLNLKTVKLPTTIALMAGALIVSMCLMSMRYSPYNGFEQAVEGILKDLDFRAFLLNGILNLLLFAGAIEIDLNSLLDVKYEVGLLAFVSTISSTFLVGVAAHYLAAFWGTDLPWLYAFLLGAVISPTDPIAVLAIFKQLGAPKVLNTTVSGESLFNDGIAIVIFATLSSLAFTDATLSVGSVSYLFLKLAIGGMAFGIALGVVGYYLIASIHDPKVEILITLAIATGGYYLAHALGVSGPLAMVTAGIFIGNQGRLFALSEDTVQILDHFWEMVDEILNAILFFLIGAEILLLPSVKNGIWMGVCMIPVILAIRAITVFIPLKGLEYRRTYPPYFKTIVIWGGLRGGLAVALALSLPDSVFRDLILVITYCKVLFSILVQGITIKPLVDRVNARQ